jgi:hypothetical protein
MPFLAALVPAFTAFAGTWFGSLVISIGASVGASLLSSWLKKDKEPQQQAKQRTPGFQLEITMGDTNPLSFPIGTAVTAGTRKYLGAWGNAGQTPNAYLTEVIQLSDIPGFTLAGFWANREKCAISTIGLTDKGFPVAAFNSGGVDHMWVKFRDGSDITVDAFLFEKFGAKPAYPWLADMVGRGTPYAIVTTLYNRELFQQQPSFLFEPAPMRVYDLRKDSTNGGTGLHRWNDQTTWEPSDNPVVIIYNIIRGIYYNGEWIYGGFNLPAFRLTPSVWRAAANECDVLMPLVGGGTEKQYRAGIEVNVDIEPLTLIEELLRSCNGRMSEIGGIFEIIAGSPGAAVYAFTDDDIVVTRKQGYRSFPSLNESHNAIEAQYPEPGEMWALKSAPARFNATWEAEDGGRRLATGLTFAAVAFGTQVQRLMASLIADDRRWRTHVLALPPDAWMLTGTCVVSWTSVRNGYINKKFLVMRIEGEPGMIQPVILREIDPSDYSWSTADQLPNPIGQLVIVRPAAQTPTGFQVFPAIFYDSDGVPRRPSIQIIYDGNMPDIQFVHVLVRLKSSGAFVYDQLLKFEAPFSNVLNGVFLPLTTYEVAIAYVAFSGRPMHFTNYLEVITDNVKLVAGKDFDPFGDVVGFDMLGPDLIGYHEWSGSSVRELIEQAQSNATNTAGQELANSLQFQEMRTEVAVSVGTLEATFTQVITVQIQPLAGQVVALADYLTELSAGDGVDVSTARFRMTNLTGPTGYSRIGAQTRVNVADPTAWRGAAWYLDTPTNPALPTRFLVEADQFIVVNGANVAQPLIFEAGVLKLQVANIGLVRAGRIQSASGASYWDLDSAAFRIATT